MTRQYHVKNNIRSWSCKNFSDIIVFQSSLSFQSVLLSTPNYCYNSLLFHSIRKCVHHCRKIESPSVSFVGATRDVDLDERDFRVGYLLSESWMAIGACTSLYERCANLIPFCSFSFNRFVPSLSSIAAETRH